MAHGILAILLIAALGGVAAHVYWPASLAVPDLGPARPPDLPTKSTSWALADFKPVWNKQLLPPPPPAAIEAPVVQPVETPQPIVVQPLPVKLAAILFSEDVQIAVFDSVTGAEPSRIRLRKGESFQEVKIVNMTGEAVEVEFKGRTVAMKVGE